MNNPSLNVAYKSSKNGFNVAAVNLLEDGKSIVNGAVSLTGKGIDDAALKLRYSIGENGKYLRQNLWTDLGKEIDLYSANVNMSMQNGIWQGSSKWGNFFGTNYTMDVKSSLDDLAKYLKHITQKQQMISHTLIMKK